MTPLTTLHAGQQIVVGGDHVLTVDAELAASFQQRMLSTQREKTVSEKLEDVANVILFLASDESAFCTGAEFVADGGATAGRVHEILAD